MDALIAYSERVKDLYGRYSNWIDIGLRFVLALISSVGVTAMTGFSSKASSPLIVIFGSVLFALLPLRLMPLFPCALLVAQSLSLGYDIAGLVMLVLLTVAIFLWRFSKDETVCMLIAPVALLLGFSPLIPILAGLRRKWTAVLSFTGGVIMYHLMHSLSVCESRIVVMGMREFSSRCRLVMQNAFTDELILAVMSGAGTLLVVAAIRGIKSEYSFPVSIGAGAFASFFLTLVGGALLGVKVSVFGAFAGALVSGIFAMLLLIFFLPVEYKKSVVLQFRDDDNYYYVKAVPIRKSRASSEDGDDSCLEADVDLEGIDLESKLEDSLKDIEGIENGEDT